MAGILLVSPEGGEREALLAGLGPRMGLGCAGEVPPGLESWDLCWLHAGPGQEGWLPEGLEGLRPYLESGGRLLLTGPPAAWTGRLGLESHPPEVRTGVFEGPLGPGERLGVAPFLDHPLFERFPGGLFLRRPQAGCALGGAFYLGGERPVEGRLLGVEKVHLGLDARRGILVEHRLEKGLVLSLGAHLVFRHEGDDRFEEHRLRFSEDLVDYLLLEEGEARGPAWPPPFRADLPVEEERLLGIPGLVPLDPSLLEGQPLLERGEGSGDFFSLAGRQGSLVLGHARTGVEEVWRLPVRFFKAFRYAFRLPEGAWIKDEDCFVKLRLRPAAVERIFLPGPGARIEELWLSERERPCLAVQLGNRGAEALEISLSFLCDHRLMWPYPEGALGRLRVGRDEEGRLFSVEDLAKGFHGLLAFSRSPRAEEREAGDEGLLHRFRFRLEEGGTLDLRLALGGDRGEAQGLLRGILDRDPLPEILARLEEEGRSGLALSLGDPELDRSLSWLRSKGREFFVRTRCGSLGYEGFLAGFETTRPGWCSGRPGYAWFFGRDGLWCSRALLPWGDRAEVRAHLCLLARTQGPGGEILHELTPAGIAHYDAADATPMFVEMSGRYVDWTRDEAFAAEIFPAVERALHCLEERDRDGDGLTENREAGHGWVEGGPLCEGLLVEVYLASFQASALLSGAGLARRLGKEALAWDWQDRAGRARKVLNEGFFDPEAGRYAHALREDGSFDRSRTVLGVMPLLLGLCSPPRAARVLEGCEDLLTAWGAGLIPRTDPRHDPSAYQGGSVWPLFTGWLSLADFLAGRPEAGWKKLRSLLALVPRFSPGVLEEAFRGDRCEPMGVCSQQAWSHAAVLGPLAEGLLGAQPSGDRLRLAPCLPAELPRLEFRNLRFGDLRLSGRVERGEGELELRLEARGKGSALLDLGGFLPGPTGEALLDGGRVPFRQREGGEGAWAWVPDQRLGEGGRLHLRLMEKTGPSSHCKS